MVATPAPCRPAGVQVVGLGVDLVCSVPRCRRTGFASYGRLGSSEDHRGGRRRHLGVPASSPAGVRRAKHAVTGSADAPGAAAGPGVRDSSWRRVNPALCLVERPDRELLRANCAANVIARGRAAVLLVGLPVAVAPPRLQGRPDYRRRLRCLRRDANHLWRRARRPCHGCRRLEIHRRPDRGVATATVSARPRQRVRDLHRAGAAVCRGLPTLAAGPSGERRPSASGRRREPGAAGGDRRAAPRGACPTEVRGKVRGSISLQSVRHGFYPLRRPPDHRRQRRLRSTVGLRARRTHRQQLRRARILGGP